MDNDLQNLIEQKEKQLMSAEAESRAWNKGKLSQSSNAALSKILVDSLEKELDELRQKLEATKNK